MLKPYSEQERDTKRMSAVKVGTVIYCDCGAEIVTIAKDLITGDPMTVDCFKDWKTTTPAKTGYSPPPCDICGNNEWVRNLSTGAR